MPRLHGHNTLANFLIKWKQLVYTASNRKRPNSDTIPETWPESNQSTAGILDTWDEDNMVWLRNNMRNGWPEAYTDTDLLDHNLHSGGQVVLYTLQGNHLQLLVHKLHLGSFKLSLHQV